MGGSNSSEEPNESLLMENYQLISNEDDRRFGDISIYKNRQTGELVWIKEVILEDEAASEHYQKYIKSGNYHNEAFMVSNPHFMKKSSSTNICGNCAGGSTLKIIMEFYERDLEGEILRRGEESVKNIFFLNKKISNKKKLKNIILISVRIIFLRLRSGILLNR